MEIRRSPTALQVQNHHCPSTSWHECPQLCRLPENVPAPISLISSRPESYTQVPPNKLIHHTTHRHGMLFAPDLAGTIHPIDDDLVVTQNLQTTMFIRAPCNIPRMAVISWSLFTFHRGIARARRLRWFKNKHHMPRVLKLFRQGVPLSPRVARHEFRNPSVPKETRERAFPIGWPARKREFPLRAVPIILLGQFGVSHLSTFHRSAMSQTLPSTCDPLHHLDSAPFATLQVAHVSSPKFAKLVDRAFSTAEPQMGPVRFMSSAQHSSGLLRRHSTRRSSPSSQIRSAWNIDCVQGHSPAP